MANTLGSTYNEVSAKLFLRETVRQEGKTNLPRRWLSDYTLRDVLEEAQRDALDLALRLEEALEKELWDGEDEVAQGHQDEGEGGG